MPNHPSTVTLEVWTGLDNKRPETRIPEGFLAEATNVDIDSGGMLRLRKGYTKIIAGTKAHSLWSDGYNEAFYVDDGTLYRINPNNPTQSTALTSGFDSSDVCYHSIGGRTYISGGGLNVVVEGTSVRSWGITTPSLAPLSTTTSGQLTAGIYRISYRYVASDGRVSAPSVYTTVTIASTGGGIHLFGIPSSTDPTVVAKEIYISTPNGETLYSAGVTTSSTFDILELHGDMVPLDYRYLDVPPEVDSIQMYNGRLYMSVGNYLWYTEPHNYEMVHMGENWIEFPSEITNVMPVDDGIFVTADKLYFLEGNDPSLLRQREREVYRAAKNTAVKIIGGDVIIENIPTGMKWLFTSDKGIVMVGTGGMVFNLTEKNVMIDSAESGAAIFRSDEGMNQYLSILKNPSNDRLHFGDKVTAVVIRNGVVID